MSNLRWIVRDGKEVLQSGWTDGKYQEWEDVPTVMNVSAKKSLAQVLYEVWGNVPNRLQDNEQYYIALWDKTAQAAMDYLEKEGWRRPNE